MTQEVSDRLTQSLHLAVDALLNLPKADNPGQVEASPLTAKPWAMTVQVDRHHGFQPLPATMTIWDVFAQPQLRRQLLILGAPGSGKTTSMLEIAQGLVKLAQADNTQPIAVLVSLSAWQQGEIFAWLVAELKTKYGIRADVGRAWLEQGVLLPIWHSGRCGAGVARARGAVAVAGWVG